MCPWYPNYIWKNSVSGGKKFPSLDFFPRSQRPRNESVCIRRVREIFYVFYSAFLSSLQKEQCAIAEKSEEPVRISMYAK
jgi:hypothetical protein